MRTSPIPFLLLIARLKKTMFGSVVFSNDTYLIIKHLNNYRMETDEGMIDIIKEYVK